MSGMDRVTAFGSQVGDDGLFDIKSRETNLQTLNEGEIQHATQNNDHKTNVWPVSYVLPHFGNYLV